ncbi:hypothetical protein HZC07_04320, partial [Candidatus Micrarchaeota archaeon]|nr:hypothetical protein [Candidatus Micrarchaeota archaeon]
KKGKTDPERYFYVLDVDRVGIFGHLGRLADELLGDKPDPLVVITTARLSSSELDRILDLKKQLTALSSEKGFKMGKDLSLKYEIDRLLAQAPKYKLEYEHDPHLNKGDFRPESSLPPNIHPLAVKEDKRIQIRP